MTRMSTPKYRAIRDDFLTTPLSPLKKVRLKGSRCRSCGETFFGHRYSCEYCQSSDMEDIVLSKRGKLFSYTVARYRPPGDYKGQDNPFKPFGIGLVELPEGLKIFTRLTDCDVDSLKVGMDVELVANPLYRDEDGYEVVIYEFKPI